METSTTEGGGIDVTSAIFFVSIIVVRARAARASSLQERIKSRRTPQQGKRSSEMSGQPRAAQSICTS